jgi:serine/threonine protein kinase
MYYTRKIDNYILGDRIGDGSTAGVYLAKNSCEDDKVALKLVNPTRIELFYNEERFFDRVGCHKNIVSMKYSMDKGMLVSNSPDEKRLRP